jgi:DNA-binding transcriptional LysR family regulator
MGGFLKNLLHTHPNLEVSFKFQNAQKIAEGVIHSTIDIGLISNPLQAIDSGQAVIICESNAPMAQTLLRKIGKDNRRIARTINVNSLEVVAHFTMEGCGIGILPSCFEHPSYHDKLTRLADLPSATSDICLIYRHENKNVAAIKAITNAIRNYRAES